MVIFCKMTTTRYGRQKTTTTTTYPHFITIKTRIIDAIASGDNCQHNQHDNYDDEHDGGVLMKSKSKTLFSGHFVRILIVILISFTFADMVHGKCLKIIYPNF